MKFFRKGNLETAFHADDFCEFLSQGIGFFLALKGEFYVVFNFTRHYFFISIIAWKFVS